jgi:hypothetical protein
MRTATNQNPQVVLLHPLTSSIAINWSLIFAVDDCSWRIASAPRPVAFAMHLQSHFQKEILR